MRSLVLLRNFWFHLVAFTVLALVIAGGSPGQARSAKSAPQGSGAGTARSAPSEPGAKGGGEGIKVHGHWTIEVRNPNGALQKHVEFENSLQGSDGSNLLTGVLSGNYTVGNWYVQLYGPCSTAHGLCAIVPPSTLIASAQNCSTSLSAASPQPFCYATLTQSLTGASPSTSGAYTSFTLSGQAYADTTTSITSVQTLATYCGGSSGTPYPLSSVSPMNCYTGSSTNSQAFTSTSLAAAPNCGGPSQLPCQVPVAAGQTIQATVVISFQ